MITDISRSSSAISGSSRCAIATTHRTRRSIRFRRFRSRESIDRAPAQANARLSSMMPYMLCVSRFAHYIKVMGRDRVGSVTSSEQLERILHDWLKKYVTPDDNASPETKARYPLREARVQVRPKPGASGAYHCVIHLVPHYRVG